MREITGYLVEGARGKVSWKLGVSCWWVTGGGNVLLARVSKVLEGRSRKTVAMNRAEVKTRSSIPLLPAPKVAVRAQSRSRDDGLGIN